MPDAALVQELDALRTYSAEIGADRYQIQGAGGNTSVKSGDAMWIKASGTHLADATHKEIFVPVDWQGIASAVGTDLDLADSPDKFVIGEGLRPSIETCLHAVLPQTIVIHTHCVNTIAIAMRSDAETISAKRLSGLNWAMVPYRKPGAKLARAVTEAAKPDTDVFVLGNHGLIVAAETVAEAAALQAEVIARMATPTAEPKGQASSQMAPQAGYSPAPAGHTLHDLAFDPTQLETVTKGGLFPDQVLFCGPYIYAAEQGQSIEDYLHAIANSQKPDPVAIIAPGIGAYIADKANATEQAMALCVGDVMQRVPPEAQLNYIPDDECGALLNWDAETYRLALSQQQGGA